MEGRLLLLLDCNTNEQIQTIESHLNTSPHNSKPKQPPPQTPKMSAPNPGRQSPEPSRNTDAQAGENTSNVNKQGGGPSEGSEQSSDNTKSSLPSNPKEQVLDQHAKDVTSKTMN
ncbi:hypothetical protein NX059_006581 [Plenodomus lindquistii]|nr:hypothetical protein NX059_006581 [Plenodomus lindquistii]